MSEDTVNKDLEQERMEKDNQQEEADNVTGKGSSAKKGKEDKQAAKKSKKKDKKFEELEEKYNELNDKYLRLYSEFDNFRKRTLKEKIELSKTASREVIIDLLPVLDDFERAMKSFDEHKNASSEEIKEGVHIIYNKLISTLKAKGLEEMDSNGKEFDTDYHEAVTQIPAPTDDMKGKVVDEIEKGYLLNGKVIRYAKVVVGS